MTLFLKYGQLLLISATVVGIYMLRTKEQSKASLYLLLTLYGCLFLNCGYIMFLMAESTEAAMAATRIQAVGKLIYLYYLQYFVVSYMKIPTRYVNKVLTCWFLLDLVNVICIWFDPLVKSVYASITFYRGRFGVYVPEIHQGPLLMARGLAVVLIFLGSMVFITWRLWYNKSEAKIEKNNLIRICTAYFMIWGSMIVSIFFNFGFDITPLWYTLAVLLLLFGVFRGELLNVAETGRLWVVNNTSDAFITVDPTFGYIDANPAAIEMFPTLRNKVRNGHIGSTLQSLFLSSEVKWEYEDKCYEITRKTIAKSGNVLGYVLIVTDVTEKERLLQRVREEKRRAEEANNAKSAFLSNMSHEIRTPMNGIVGITEIMLRENLPPHQEEYLTTIKRSGESLIEIINDILDYSKIESNKLEILEYEYEPMSMFYDLSVIFLSRIGQRNVKLLYDIDPALPAKLCGDALRVKQIITNFVNNAVKFTEEGFVKLAVRIVDSNESDIELEFSVEDSGQGIKQEDLSKLFSSFQQVNTKKNHEKEGTGLGLALSQRLVALMGGNISVESEYGVGSRFSFTIKQHIVGHEFAACVRNVGAKRNITGIFDSPYYGSVLKKLAEDYGLNYVDPTDDSYIADYFFTDTHEVFERESGRFYDTDANRFLLRNPITETRTDCDVELINEPLYSMTFCQAINREVDSVKSVEKRENYYTFKAPKARILIVDDNEINLSVAIGLLEPTGVQTETACNGKEAVEKVSTQEFDIIFMDHMMPIMDGVEATNAIRKLDGLYYRTVPIIALTANVIEEAKEMFEVAGLSDFLSKPVRVKELMEVLERWLPPDYIEKTDGVCNDGATDTDSYPVIPGVDMKMGIETAGTSKQFFELLKQTYHLIDSKASYMEECLTQGRIKDYTIEVHAMKNTARLVGMPAMSELFAELEKLGKAGNVEAILCKSPIAIKMLRGFKETISPFVTEDTAKSAEISCDMLHDLLQSMEDAAACFDIDTVDAVRDELDRYILPEFVQCHLDKLHACIADVNTDEIISIVQQIKEVLVNT